MARELVFRPGEMPPLFGDTTATLIAANQLLITVANAGRRRCLEIERRAYLERLGRRVDDLTNGP